MSDYIWAQTDNKKSLFLHAGKKDVAGYVSNTSASAGGGDDYSVLLSKEIYAKKSTRTLDDHIMKLSVVVPKYLSVASMICNVFGEHARIDKLIINSTSNHGKAQKVIGTYTFEDGHIEDYTIYTDSIEINLEFAKLSVEDHVSQTMGISDSRHN